MPHLVEMQNKFADKGVQIISISNEDLETVEKFLEREFKGAPAKEENRRMLRINQRLIVTSPALTV